MRNDFAHEWGPIDFEDPRVSNRLQTLIGKHSKETDDDESLPLPGGIPFGVTKGQLIKRLAFILTVSKIIGRIDVITENAREGKNVRYLVTMADLQKGE